MIFSFLIATFVMSDILFVFFVGSTKIGEITDISKCFENFVSQALGVLTRVYAAELRIINKQSNDRFGGNYTISFDFSHFNVIFATFFYSIII